LCAARYRQLLPLCDQIVRFRIGIGELLAVRKVDTEKMSYSGAAFALIDGIDTSDKLLDVKKQLNDTWMQTQMVDFFSARQNKALTSLI